MSGTIGAVVVDHDAGPLLEGCVRSLLEDGAAPGRRRGERRARERRAPPSEDLARPAGPVRCSCGPAATWASAPGSTGAWRPWRARRPRRSGSWSAIRTSSCTRARWQRCGGVLETEPAWALVGPRIFTETGRGLSLGAQLSLLHRCRRARTAGALQSGEPLHAALQPRHPRGRRGTEAGWVSGSCFLARRSALEELGGFDESYFMYKEDMDLCWRAHNAGWGVGSRGRRR